MRTEIFALITALSLATPASAARAQRPQTRDGVNVSFGVGGGSAGLGCDGCTHIRHNGTLFYLNVGGTLSPHLTLGGELNGFAHNSAAQDISIGSLMAVAHFYPARASGFFLTGGAGFTSSAITNHFDGTDLAAAGPGLEAGLGYDVRLGRNFSLTPYGQVVRSFDGRVSYNGVSSSQKFHPDYFQIGLGLTWH